MGPYETSWLRPRQRSLYHRLTKPFARKKKASPSNVVTVAMSIPTVLPDEGLLYRIPGWFLVNPWAPMPRVTYFPVTLSQGECVKSCEEERA